MSALIAPLLAQLVTLGVADRTEARYYAPSSYNYEGSTRPSVRLQIAWPRYSLSFGYSAGISLVPLESTPRDLLVFHSASVGNVYTYRRTSVSLGASGSFGEVNFRTQALGTTAAFREPDPATPTTGGSGTDPKPDPNKPNTPAGAPPTTGTNLQPTVIDGPVRYGTVSINLGVGHQVSRDFRLSAAASHSLAGGLNDTARANYPFTRGTVVGFGATYVYRMSGRDTFATSASTQQAWSSLGTRVTSLQLSEGWNHRFNQRTASTLSAGVSTTRVPFGEYSAYSVFPTFGAFLSHNRRLARGTLTLAAGTYSAPTLDPLRATVDPRIGLSGSVGWARDRFSSRIGGGAAVSVADSGNNLGAFNSASASAGVGYRLAKWIQADAGASLARQSFRSQVTIPLTYAAFVGVTVALEAPLAGRKR